MGACPPTHRTWLLYSRSQSASSWVICPIMSPRAAIAPPAPQRAGRLPINRSY